jgi:hypothetical protein
MALIDRFRAQAGHKHADAAVRLSFVQELPLDERDLLAEIARDDADPRVRRAAVDKLMDPPALAGVARSDADDAVRTRAATMLRDIAIEAFEGLGEAESLAAVDALVALTDAKTLTAVAKSAPRESTAQRALASVTDARTLGSVARHSAHESVRQAAFGALQDHGEVLSVALNGEFRDPTLAAVDRIAARGELEQIAARAKNKSAAKRARVRLREQDERQAQEAAAAAAAVTEALVLASQPDPAELERRALAEAARQAADEAVRADEAARVREQDEASARHREEQAASVAEAAAKEAERRLGRLAELVVEAEAAAADEDFASARRRMGAARRECRDLTKDAAFDGDVAQRMGAADARFTARETAAREGDQRARRDALVRLQQFITRLEALAALADLTLKAGERGLKDIRTLLGAMPQLPSKRDYDEALLRLKAAQAALMPKVQELRDIADWQRWANIGIQEQLCEKMEALTAVEDPAAIARHVKDFQEQWRQASDAPRAQGDALWRRFKAAHDEAWKRCESHFAALAGERAESLAKKIALCERAEALAESTSWIQTADEIKRLQAEWKSLGPVTRGQEKATWERFRAACDRFFSRRHADLADRKKAWAENLARKEALSAKAEALVDSMDWDAAAAAIKQLQAEWKTIGPVKRTRSDAIWQRFRTACDAFFTRYVQRHDIARGERAAARETICAELEALAAPAELVDPQPAVEAAPAELVAKVRALRGRWQQELAARGVDGGRAAALDERFATAFARVIARWPAVFGGTDLDPEANRRKMEGLALRMEELAKSLGGTAAGVGDAALSPTTRLAAMLKEALASNTIGGKVDDDSRWRAAAEELRQAQASWTRIGPVPDTDRRALTDRFSRACRQIADSTARAPSPPPSGARPQWSGPKPGGAGRGSGR